MAIDTNSDEWREIEAWAQKQLDRAHTVVMAAQCPERAADVHRGIAICAQSLLNFGRNKKGPEVPPGIEY